MGFFLDTRVCRAVSQYSGKKCRVDGWLDLEVRSKVWGSGKDLGLIST